jgi:hypothetical protein
MKKTVFVLICLALLIRQSHATIINVPSEYSTIQNAIEASSNGDTILVQPGTYLESINFNGKNVVLASLFILSNDTSYVSKTIIDANKKTTVITFSNGEDSTAMVVGFTIQNGFCTREQEIGYGIYCSHNSKPIIRNSRVINNEGWMVGGIKCIEAQIKLESVIVSNNKGDSYTYSNSGGIYCQSSSLFLKDVQISNNVGDHSGGIMCKNSKVILQNVQINYNKGSSSWGGNYFYNSSIEFEGGCVLGNWGWHGGGITCDSSNIKLKDVLFSGNSNGALSITNGSKATVENIIATSNVGESDQEHGIIYVNGASLQISKSCLFNNSFIYGATIKGVDANIELINCTIFGNKGQGGTGVMAGGLFTYNSSAVVVNSILWRNAPDQIGTWFAGGSSVYISHSDIQGGEDSIFVRSADQYAWLDGNINKDPGFVDSASNDFNLKESSLCLDRGTPLFIFQGDTILNLNENDYDGLAPDLGAYESAFSSGILNPPSTIDAPTTFTLIPNYPNPFTSITQIIYYLPKVENLRIDICNLQGQMVFTKQLQSLSTGYHYFNWDGVDSNGQPVPSGVYLAKLSGKAHYGYCKMFKLK